MSETLRNIGRKQEEIIFDFKLSPCSVCFLLGDSPASEFYKPTFRNTLSVPSS
jgi:hypothetical protein